MLLLLLKNRQWDVCTGRRCSVKETVFGSLPNFCCLERRSRLNRISHPDWMKLCVELNCAPNQNSFCYKIKPIKWFGCWLQLYDTKSNIKLDEFWSLPQASYVSCHIEELWYKPTKIMHRFFFGGVGQLVANISVSPNMLPEIFFSWSQIFQSVLTCYPRFFSVGRKYFSQSLHVTRDFFFSCRKYFSRSLYITRDFFFFSVGCKYFSQSLHVTRDFFQLVANISVSPNMLPEIFFSWSQIFQSVPTCYPRFFFQLSQIFQSVPIYYPRFFFFSVGCKYFSQSLHVTRDFFQLVANISVSPNMLPEIFFSWSQIFQSVLICYPRFFSVGRKYFSQSLHFTRDFFFSWSQIFQSVPIYYPRFFFSVGCKYFSQSLHVTRDFFLVGRKYFSQSQHVTRDFFQLVANISVSPNMLPEIFFSVGRKYFSRSLYVTRDFFFSWLQIFQSVPTCYPRIFSIGCKYFSQSLYVNRDVFN